MERLCVYDLAIGREEDLMTLVGAFVLLGETLRDALDPRVFGRG